MKRMSFDNHINILHRAQYYMGYSSCMLTLFAWFCRSYFSLWNRSLCCRGSCSTGGSSWESEYCLIFNVVYLCSLLTHAVHIPLSCFMFLLVVKMLDITPVIEYLFYLFILIWGWGGSWIELHRWPSWRATGDWMEGGRQPCVHDRPSRSSVLWIGATLISWEASFGKHHSTFCNCIECLTKARLKFSSIFVLWTKP